MGRLFRNILLGTTLLLVSEVPLTGQSLRRDVGPVALQPGDVVKISVWQRPELSGEFEVAPDGTIVHPLYREIRVTDVPVDQLEGRLRAFLSRLEANPQFVIQPLVRVAVLGAVVKPDVYTLPAGATVGYAVAAAGGVAADGKLEDVRFIRGGSETRIDLTSGSQDPLMMVSSGDQLVVEQRGSGFFGFWRGNVVPVIATVTSVAAIWRIATWDNR
jgi:protein involved in polysaccharide export with SLBB domain